jgi:hypothetical protein
MSEGVDGMSSTAGRYAAVLSVTDRYLRAMHCGDADLLREIWHPTGRAYKVKSGLKDVIVEGIKEITDALEKMQKCPKDLIALDAVDSVDFAGPDTCMVRVHFAIPPTVRTEFLSILFHCGEWRIVSKVSTSINHMHVSDISYEDVNPREPSEALRGFIGNLDNYFLGWHGANVDELKEIFHDVATLHCAEGVRLPRIRSRGVFFEQMRAGSVDFNPSKLKFDKVLKIEKAGQYVAMVKLQLGYPPALFTSHLSLLFVAGRWQIVSESIYSQAFELEAKSGEGDAVRKFFSATPYQPEKPKPASGLVGGDKWQGYLQSLLSKSGGAQPKATERLNANRLSAAAKKPEPVAAPEPVVEEKPKPVSPLKRTADLLNNMPSLSHANKIVAAYMEAGSYVDKMSVLATLEGGVLVERQLLRGLESKDLGSEEMTQVYDYFDQKAEREGRLSRVNRPKAASPPPPPEEEAEETDEASAGEEGAEDSAEAGVDDSTEAEPLADEDFFAGIPNRQIKPVTVKPHVKFTMSSTSPTNYSDVLSQMGPNTNLSGNFGDGDDDGGGDDDDDFQMLDELGDGAL